MGNSPCYIQRRCGRVCANTELLLFLLSLCLSGAMSMSESEKGGKNKTNNKKKQYSVSVSKQQLWFRFLFQRVYEFVIEEFTGLHLTYLGN